MFCVECGREGELIGSVCKDCYSKKHAIASLPEHVDLTLCAHCSSMETAAGWKDVSSMREAVERAIESSLLLAKGARVSESRIEIIEKDERNLQVNASLMVSLQGAGFERELSTIVRVKRGSCNECSKQQGRYYEAILQVRGPDRTLQENVKSEVQTLVKERVAAMRKSSREVFLSKVEQVKGGLDFYFSTIQSARSIARELEASLCAEYKESSSLWGRRDGKDVYRMTFLVRLLAFDKGDIVKFDSKLYYVTGLGRGMLHGVDIAAGEERSIHLQSADECVLVLPKARILKAVVVAESKSELQALDPEGLKTVDVKKPKGFSRKGEQVRLVKTADGYFVLSDSW